MIRTTREDAQAHLPDLIAAARGEEVLIAAEGMHGEQVVRLVSVSPERPRPRFGSAKGLLEMGEDFDAPLPDFAEYR